MSRIFLELLNISVTASYLILAIIIVRLVMKKAPKWIVCLLWGLVAIRLLFPFQPESTLSLIPDSQPIPVEIEDSGTIVINTEEPSVNSTAEPDVSDSITEDKAVSENPVNRIIEIVSMIWFTGMSALLIYAVFSFARLKQKVRLSIRLYDNIYLCDEIESPFILGIIKPRIYLSSQIPRDVWECILMHERAHLKRGDHFWKPLGFFLLSVYWFNPLFWVAYILLCKDIELACDEKATKDMNRNARADYCKALLECSVNRKMLGACPVAFGEVGVKNRIKLVLNYKKPSFWIITAALIVCVLVSVCFLTNPKSRISVLEYKDMNYGEYQKKTGNDAEFLHASFYVGKLPKTNAEIVYAGEYSEELGGSDLSENAKPVRIQGALCDLVELDKEQLSETELIQKLSEQYGNVVSVEYCEGAGTAYYVSDFYIHISVDLDSDEMADIIFEVSAEEQDGSEREFQANAYTWIGWEENTSEKVEEEDTDENGYRWLSEKVFIYEFEDFDGNGVNEYVEVDLTDRSTEYDSHFTFYWNGEAIYEYDDGCRISPGDAEYLDLDGDGEKEIFFPFYPWVNSMPLSEYIVLKQKDDMSWETLEMIHGETMMDNAFPLSVTKGNTKWEAVITCENLEKRATYDVEWHYLNLKEGMEKAGEQEYFKEIVTRYEREFVEYPAGEICGNVSSWGIWQIKSGEYQGQPCLIASHGIECYGKFDSWGEADVYFNYDTQGKTRFLDIQFRPNEVYQETEQETVERIYEGITPQAAYGDIAEMYLTVGQYAKEVKDSEKAMIVAENAYISQEYLAAICYYTDVDYVFVYVLHDLNGDGIEEFFIGLKSDDETPRYTIYDVYTWKDGRAYQLMRDIGYRSGSCIICENGVIKDESNSSAAEGQVLYHILPRNGITLETIDQVKSEWGSNNDVVYYHGTEKVDRDIFFEVQKQYQTESVTYVEYNSDTIEKLRQS